MITILRYNLYLSRSFLLATSKHPLHHKNINVWKLLQYPVLLSINIRLLGEEADASLIILPIRRLRQNHVLYFIKIRKKDYIGKQS